MSAMFLLFYDELEGFMLRWASILLPLRDGAAISGSSISICVWSLFIHIFLLFSSLRLFVVRIIIESLLCAL